MRKKYLFLLIIFLIFSFSVFFFSFNKTQAGLSHNVYGYAWSSNIGWISFNNCFNPLNNNGVSNCSGVDYGVKYDTATGDLTGYAWSSNIGWIQFGNLNNLPTINSSNLNQAKLDLNNPTNAKMTGWAKALSANGNGWDGWISLSGNNYAPTFNLNTGLANSNSWAWGSSVIGWIDFSGVSLAPLMTNSSVSLTANPSSINSGQSSVLSWVGNDLVLDKCTNSWGQTQSQSQNQPTSGTYNTGSLTSSKTYTISCLGNNGNTVSDTVTVTVNNLCNNPNASNYGGSLPCLLPNPNPTLNAYISPANGKTNLDWDNAFGCKPDSIDGNDDVNTEWNNVDLSSLNNSVELVDNVLVTTYFVIDCSGIGGGKASACVFVPNTPTASGCKKPIFIEN